MSHTNLVLCDQPIGLGERKKIFLEVAKLYDFTAMTIPIEVVRGLEPGPTLFVSAAIHGDELNGIEVIRRLLEKKSLAKIKGTLICVPVVNVHGFNARSRYLPDRRDLNRSFPGSSRGSLAAQIAHVFMKEVVHKSTHGIDIHTGAVHRRNLPQIRACLGDKHTRQIAEAFGVPVILNSEARDGSLREAARKKNLPMLLFEGGEALRFDEGVIRVGVKGCLAVMRKIGMLPSLDHSVARKECFVAKDSFWVRAAHSGSVRFLGKLGETVRRGDVLAIIQDLFGKTKIDVVAPASGVIIGTSCLPLVNRGDAMFHIATFENLGKLSRQLKSVDLSEGGLFAT